MGRQGGWRIAVATGPFCIQIGTVAPPRDRIHNLPVEVLGTVIWFPGCQEFVVGERPLHGVPYQKDDLGIRGGMVYSVRGELEGLGPAPVYPLLIPGVMVPGLAGGALNVQHLPVVVQMLGAVRGLVSVLLVRFYDGCRTHAVSEPFERPVTATVAVVPEMGLLH